MKKHKVLNIFVLFSMFCLIKAQSQPSFSSSTENKQNYLWRDLVNLPKAIFEQAFLPSYVDFEKILQTNFTASFDSDKISTISNSCSESLQVALAALQSRRTWAIKMFSSWGRLPPASLASGTLTDLGEYDQCLNSGESLKNPENLNNGSIEDSGFNFTPQYCLLDATFPMPPLPKHHNYFQPVENLLPTDGQNVSTEEFQTRYNIRSNSSTNLLFTLFQTLQQHASVLHYVQLKMGTCLPNTCSEADIRLVAEQKIKLLGLKLKKISCENFGKKSADQVSSFFTAQTVARTIIYFILLITVTAAFFTQTRWKNVPKLAFFHWFSPLDNVQKLFVTDSNKEMKELACIHGLRAITLLWIITAHTLEWTSLNIYRDTFLIKDRLASAKLQIIYKAFYAVETFFYFSGFLTAIVTLKYTGGRYQRFHYLEFLTLRWARLTPQLALFLLLSVGLVASSFDGPLWRGYMHPLVENCQQNWWINLLYLQNLVKTDAICAVHTWYLAADMQLHFLSLLPIVSLLINRKFGQIVAVLIAFACAVISGVQVFIKRLPPGHIVTSKNDFLNEDGMPSDFVAFLYQPWNHGSVFFIGLFFGVYFFRKFLSKKAKQKRVKIQMKQSTKYLLWITGSANYLFCLYSTYPYVLGSPYYDYENPRNLYNLLPAILFPLNRIVWALALTSAIWLCATGNGGYLQSFLTWSAFKPLSRASYALYLTHAWVVWVGLGTRRTLIDLADGWSLTFHLVAVIFISIFLGIIFNILIETPFINAMEQYKKRRELMITKDNFKNFKKFKGQEINLQELDTTSFSSDRKEIKVIISTSLIE